MRRRFRLPNLCLPAASPIPAIGVFCNLESFVLVKAEAAFIYHFPKSAQTQRLFGRISLQQNLRDGLFAAQQIEEIQTFEKFGYHRIGDSFD